MLFLAAIAWVLLGCAGVGALALAWISGEGTDALPAATRIALVAGGGPAAVLGLWKAAKASQVSQEIEISQKKELAERYERAVATIPIKLPNFPTDIGERISRLGDPASAALMRDATLVIGRAKVHVDCKEHLGDEVSLTEISVDSISHVSITDTEISQGRQLLNPILWGVFYGMGFTTVYAIRSGDYHSLYAFGPFASMLGVAYTLLFSESSAPAVRLVTLHSGASRPPFGLFVLPDQLASISAAFDVVNVPVERAKQGQRPREDGRV